MEGRLFGLGVGGWVTRHGRVRAMYTERVGAVLK
jgi:hypothetical protein